MSAQLKWTNANLFKATEGYDQFNDEFNMALSKHIVDIVDNNISIISRNKISIKEVKANHWNIVDRVSVDLLKCLKNKINI